VSIAIVASPVANKPWNGGFAWVPLSYALGLRRLGFDVFLFEQLGGVSASDNAYFNLVASEFGLERTVTRQIAVEAELLVNISGHATEEWLVNGPRFSAYIDTDPGFTQIWNSNGLLHPSIRNHTHHFSVGCNLGGAGGLVPDDGIQWRPLPPPVVLDEWPMSHDVTDGSDVRFTTVATWRCPSGAVTLDGKTYLPSKLHEFRRMLSLPSLVRGAGFEIALDIQPPDEIDRQNLMRSGWTLVDPRAVARDPSSFRQYVTGSAAEFSTAQGIYAAGRTGWISDRSVKYLACGRPVLVQETGVSKEIAGGLGMLTFSTIEEARRAAESIAADYSAHATAARRLAETFFDSDRVLGDMLEEMGARP
jgi:hypothetical protein